MMHYYHPLNKNGFGNNGMLGRSPKPWWLWFSTTHAVVIILMAGIIVAVNSWWIFDYYYMIKMTIMNYDFIMFIVVYSLLSFFKFMNIDDF